VAIVEGTRLDASGVSSVDLLQVTCDNAGMTTDLLPTIADLFAQAFHHHQSGHLVQAEALYRQILGLKPDVAEAHNNLAIVLWGLNRLEEAEASSRAALRLQPGFAEAHSTLGIILGAQGKLEEAGVSYRAALRIKPGYAEAYSNLAMVLRDLGKLEEAEACSHEALRLNPSYAHAYCSLGLILRDQGKLEEAEASSRAALRLKPDYAEAHNNLCNVLWDLGRLEEAEASSRAALRLNPGYADAHNNLGNVLLDQGKLEEAEACFRETLRLTPGHAEGHMNMGHYWFLRGNFSQGGPEYEWRRLIKDNRGNSPPPPTWDGSALEGQTILLQAEQGLGDTLQFIRYARLVKAKGGRVLLQCQPALAGVLAHCPGIDQLVAPGTLLLEYHVTAPLLSLPMLCGTTLETIPTGVPYLATDTARIDYWRARLAVIPGFKVGICWQGDPRFRRDRLRSVPLAYFAPLAAVPGVCLVALQRGQGLEQITQGGEHPRVVDLPGRSEDRAEGWLDTAALIQALDLVISVDTAVVHLAGALGAPVWIALPFQPDWRWLLNREDSPWYPTMRLFRQRKPGDWADVFQRIDEALHQLVATQKTGNLLPKGHHAHGRTSG
jgi:tetratricopeptide (TPR) repeat protein